MTFPPDTLVAYAGRAGRVRGIQSVEAAGVELDALEIALTAPCKGVMHVPLDRAARLVERISMAQASALDAEPPPIPRGREQRLAQQGRLAAARERLAEYGRLGRLSRYA